MEQKNQMTEIAARSLGSENSYAVYTDKFDPSLLNPMPRRLAREDWGITGNEFVGVDIWHCHEASFLLDSGVPIAGTLKFVYDACTEFMVESKSVKLYLNSFDMCKMGKTLEEAIRNYETQVAHDLSQTVQGEVNVKFFDNMTYKKIPKVNCFSNYKDLFEVIEFKALEEMEIDDYHGRGSYIEIDVTEREALFSTNILRSRCRHTKQKDTGEAFVMHRSSYGTVEPMSLLKQIVSLREVNEFHEFCAEKIFTEIKNKSQETDDIMVALLYSRRGGIDINPIRATRYELIPFPLRNENILTEKMQCQ